MRPETVASAGLGALGSAVNPILLAKGLFDFAKGRSEARRAENAERYNAALDELLQSGVNPFELYSPDVVNALLGSPEGLDTLAGMYPGDIRGGLESGTLTPYDISQDLAFGMVSDMARKQSGLAPQYDPVKYGKDVVDTIVGILGDAAKGVVLGPGGVTGNVDWGGGTMAIPGRDPAIYTGTYGDVNTGVSTGNSTIDAAIRRVLDQDVGGKTTTSDVLIEEVAKAAGVPIDEVIDIFEDTGVLTSPNAPSPGAGTTPPQPQPGASTTTQSGGQQPGTQQPVDPDQPSGTTIGVSNEPSLFEKVRDWIRKNPEATDEQIRTAAEGAGVTAEDIAGATGMDIDTVQDRWDNAGTSTIDTGGTSTIDTGVGGQGPGMLEPPPGSIDTPTPPSGGGGGGGGGGGLDLDSLVPQYRSVEVKESPLAEIEYLFDIGGDSIFAPKMEEDDEEPKNLARIRRLGGIPYGYAQGGQVDIVELARQLLER
jgi:hypothetical protein